MSTILLAVASALSMLSQFTNYIVGDYQWVSQEYACFRGENTMGSDERGVRTNADLSMICAFMGRYAKGQVDLPANVSWQQLDTMALKSLAWAIDTHKAVARQTCADGRYWGSTGRADSQWESSLWALSVAYTAFFQWDRLTERMKADVHRLLTAECNYELERDIPTGYKYDTKAEENGWEVGVLAVTLGLFPTDSLAPRWFERMREFAINSYSHPSDSTCLTVIDPWWNRKTVADMYRGANLYPDWTLQNHGFFHTSYQNVVIQELGEAALALELFQRARHEAPATGRWHSAALMHNCHEVAENVLNWLTLPDGEQAMPNSNDWSLFLYDQVTSYTTLACMTGDADALMLERRALEQIARRQKTTGDGSWLLNPDVGARRMGVEAHRVMMTWLMHHVFPTDHMQPSTWEDFARRHAEAKSFPCQHIVRTLTDDYFACFSLSEGKQSYTGYIAPHCPADNNMVVPMRRFNTGNIIGYYDNGDGKPNARLTGEPELTLNGKYFTVRATLAENDSTLLRHFTLSSTSHGLEYSDKVTKTGKGKVSLKPNSDRTGMMAISYDPFTRTERSVELKPGQTVVDSLLTVEANTRAKAALTDPSTDNSVRTLKLYPFYNSPQWQHRVVYSVERKR